MMSVDFLMRRDLWQLITLFGLLDPILRSLISKNIWVTSSISRYGLHIDSSLSLRWVRQMFGNNILVGQCDSIPLRSCIASNDAVDLPAIDLQAMQLLRYLLDLRVVFFLSGLSLLGKVVSFAISHGLKRLLGE